MTKMVNGVATPDSAADIAQAAIDVAAMPAQQAAMAQAIAANPAAQIAAITALLITKAVILKTDLPAAQITAVNQTLTAIGQTTIK